MRLSPALACAVLALSCAAGCARCSPAPAPDAGSHEPLLPEELLPPPRPWTFVRMAVAADIALPERCRMRAPMVRADVSPATRFVAEPRSLASLIVADAKGDPPALTGVAALGLDPAGSSRDPVALPWFEAASLPRLARSGATWLAAIDRPGASASSSRVVLWRAGTAELVGDGDGFEAFDLGCASDRCALLTSRLARVAQPGATLWLGAPGDPAGRWKPVEITPTAPDSDARPFGIASIEVGEAGAVAVLLEKGSAVFERVSLTGAREEARIPAPHGITGAIALPAPAIMASATAVDDEGCARDGRPGVRFAGPGQPDVVIPAAAPPQRGHLRQLARGALAVWIAPLGCKQTRRVAFGVVLGADGAPAGAPVPIGDASAVAVAASGDDVDLWLQDPTSVTWTRMTCTAP